MLTFFLLLMWGVFAVQSATAQNLTIQGIVSTESTGQPLEGANMALQGISNDITDGAATDRGGYYRITGLEPGEYKISISFVGYVTYQDTISLGEYNLLTINISLEISNEELDEVIIAQKGGAAQLDDGIQRIRQIDLQRIPTPAAGGDLANYLQTLPSVVSAGDRGGQFFVRGGTPSQNLVLVDGTMMYRPFHIVGFFSAFPEDLVSGVDFHAGGFGARYHGRISSVLDVQMRDGNRQQFTGSVSMSPFQGGFLVEGPLKKGKTSFIGSFQNSLIEQTSPHFLEDRQPLKFGSQYLKVSYSGEYSRCSALTMHTYDRGRLDPDLTGSDLFRWTNFLFGGRCIFIPKTSPGLIELNSGYSYVNNAAGNPEQPERTANAQQSHVDLNLTRFLGDVRFDYGFFIRMKWFNYDLQEQYQLAQNDEEAIMGFGGYLETNIPWGEKLELYPGLVLSVYPWTFDPALEPRFRMTWNPRGTDAQELNASIGLYRQPIIGIGDDRDAGNPFTAWMVSPFGGAMMSSLHSVLGWQQQLGDGFHISAEGYYKKLKDLPVAVWSSIARFTTKLTLAEGKVYGSDLRLEYNRNQFYAYVGYGYSWTRYYSSQDNFNLWFGEPVQSYHPLHDRRHQVNGLISLSLGKYTASLNWQLGTGMPYTRHMGFDELINLQSLPDIRRQYGTPRIILDKPYRGRLPAFHRLDFSVERSLNLSMGVLDLTAGVINMYNRANLFYYDVYTQRRIDQLPFLPYLSVKLEAN
ncbi:TonB-dependent receptor [Aliifodinibius sp. S!AR15-10]|uniref:TonB-dependent receptor n=1 Tax=Aliifodinibius sp. S!AR15-10 TaxID=2950437 RepID=UPI00285CF0BA|nr:TonB-dependent receptor [Aliifodinibius sp. S!AR15-10]MDR8392312.1 TonB-dependent receptor [Aliifodinibius sp. S!AR15-10]